MTWIENSLAIIEEHLRDLFEGWQAMGGFPAPLHRQLRRLLARSLLAASQPIQGKDGAPTRQPQAPDQFTLVLPPAQASLLWGHPAEQDQLIRGLERLADRAGLRFNAPPILRVVEDPAVVSAAVRLGPDGSGLEFTHTTSLGGDPARSNLDGMPKSYLVINGLHTFPLTRPVINIGRDPANHLVLADPAISRSHAQLRFIRQRFTIFDLDSLGGTFVNEVAVTSHVLSTGDVIRLAGIPLVYGEEAALSPGYTQELPSQLPPPEIL